MESDLDMHAAKSASFSVTALLDLPEGGKITACTSPRVEGEGLDLTTTASVPTLNSVPPAYYDNSDNPYTRWLQTNENIHYTGTWINPYLLHTDIHTRQYLKLRGRVFIGWKSNADIIGSIERFAFETAVTRVEYCLILDKL